MISLSSSAPPLKWFIIPVCHDECCSDHRLLLHSLGGWLVIHTHFVEKRWMSRVVWVENYTCSFIPIDRLRVRVSLVWSQKIKLANQRRFRTLVWLAFIRIFLSFYIKSQINIDMNIIKPGNFKHKWSSHLSFHNNSVSQSPITNMSSIILPYLLSLSFSVYLSLAFTLSQSFYIKTIFCVMYINHSWFEITSCWNVTLLSWFAR